MLHFYNPSAVPIEGFKKSLYIFHVTLLLNYCEIKIHCTQINYLYSKIYITFMYWMFGKLRSQWNFSKIYENIS